MTVRTHLMKHQQDIVDFVKDKSYAGIFAEYGTGKTLCIIKLTEVKQWSKVLVVCSKTAILATWPSEIVKHSDFNYVFLTGTKQKRIDALSMGLFKARGIKTSYSADYIKPTFFLINFDGVKSIFNELVASSFDAIIVDESTKIKYPTTTRTKVLWALSKSIATRLILTGWPITESPQDLYSQIKFLDRGITFGNSYYGFMDKYFVKAKYKYAPKKGSTQDIIKAIEGFCIRVTNESLNLPPKRYFKMDIEQSDQQKNILRQLKDYMQAEVGKVKIDTEYIFALLTRSAEICDGFIKDNWFTKELIQQENQQDYYIYICSKCNNKYNIEKGKQAPPKCRGCGHPGNYEMIETEKDETLLELLEEIDAKNHKVLIWTPFRFTQIKLRKLLENKKYNVLSLTGETKDDDVSNIINKFMLSIDNNILLLTTKKASESLNLTNCNIAIYYSNEYSYDRRANSEARIYRKGSEKHKSVIYIDFVTKKTIEEAIYNCLHKKKDLVNALKEMFGLKQEDKGKEDRNG